MRVRACLLTYVHKSALDPMTKKKIEKSVKESKQNKVKNDLKN